MGIVVDIVARTFCHILTISQVEHSEDYSGYGNNGKQQYLAPRIEKDIREEDGRYRTRCSDRYIIRIVMPFDHIINRGKDHSAEVKPQIPPTTEAQIVEHPFYIRPERPVSKHIHQQMRHIGMHKTMRHQPVPFIVLYRAVRYQRQLSEQFPIIETEIRGNNSYTYNNVCDHLLLARASLKLVQIFF